MCKNTKRNNAYQLVFEALLRSVVQRLLGDEPEPRVLAVDGRRIPEKPPTHMGQWSAWAQASQVVAHEGDAGKTGGMAERGRGCGTA